jgi:hypothetical protein
MAFTKLGATAATCKITPGTQQQDDQGKLHIKGQVFSDIVESQDPRIAETNKPTLDLDLNPESGEGELSGGFTLRPKTVAGTWEGQMRGRFIKGLVRASGVARGTGALEGSVLIRPMI